MNRVIYYTKYIKFLWKSLIKYRITEENGEYIIQCSRNRIIWFDVYEYHLYIGPVKLKTNSLKEASKWVNSFIMELKKPVLRTVVKEENNVSID